MNWLQCCNICGSVGVFGLVISYPPIHSILLRPMLLHTLLNTKMCVFVVFYCSVVYRNTNIIISN